MWCIPPQQDAAFVASMEETLEVYQRPYDPRRPVVNMDEQCKQLIRETRIPLPVEPGKPQRVDFEYERQGVAVLWMFTEPLDCWRDVRLTSRRTAVDWAHQVRRLVDDERYRDAEKITLVCDNLNTHRLASVYQAFEPAEALRLARKIELVHTPRHGSWLNIAECELSVVTRQCLNRRIATMQQVQREVDIWQADRNASQVGVDWQFRTDDARIKLKRLYPNIQM